MFRSGTVRWGPSAGLRHLAGALLAALLVMLPVGPAAPGVAGRVDADDRSSSRNGPRSYQEIAAAVAHETPGRILRIRLIRRGGRAFYLVRVLRPDGKRRDIVFDSVTLAVSRSKPNENPDR